MDQNYSPILMALIQAHLARKGVQTDGDTARLMATMGGGEKGVQTDGDVMRRWIAQQLAAQKGVQSDGDQQRLLQSLLGGR